MKIKKSIVDNRRNNILDYIKENNEISTQELVEAFDVSEITIRRDLSYLESIGKVQRFYGGAKINEEKDEKNEHR